MDKVYAVIEDNTVINIIVGVEDKVIKANPKKYIDYTDGWDFDNGINGSNFFIKPSPIVEEATE